MTGLLIKLIVCPLTIIISDIFFESISYANIYQAIIVGIILAVTAQLMEVFLLTWETFWLSTALDFIGASLIIFLSGYIFTNSRITFDGILLTASLLTITEFFVHRYLIQTSRVIK